MSRLLVVQPDSAQADALREALRRRMSEDVVVAESVDDALSSIVAESLDDALSSIDQCVPDVVLLPTLLPSAVENYLIAYLGALPDAGHVQILGLPHLERSEYSDQRRARSLFAWRPRQRSRALVTEDCDPGVFTRDLIAYVASARALKTEIELRAPYAALREKPERRSEPRFASHEVPWISYVNFGAEGAALINVSSRGVLLRTRSRPKYGVLRRSDPNPREQSPLTLELGSDSEVCVKGRIVRCIPVRTIAPTEYEIAFAFDYSVDLHLPVAGALVKEGA